MRISLIIIILLSIQSCSAAPQQDSLKQQITTYLSDKAAVTGVAVRVLETGEGFVMNDDHKYPLMSVFKLHIAIVVMDKVDKGALSLNQNIHIQKSDLLPNTWSPIAKKYPEGDIDLSLHEVLTYTVAQSDNNGCDILLRLIGGVQAVETFFHERGFTDLAIKVNEEEMHAAESNIFLNYTTISEAANVLAALFKQEFVSAASTAYLKDILYNTTTGGNRLRSLLPAGTPVAHKTGTSGQLANGVEGAVNDIGIIDLPNGQHLIVCVMVRNSSAGFEATEKIIADISLLAWEYFND